MDDDRERPILHYADRVDDATMSPRRRLIRWGRTWSLAALAAIGWLGCVVVASQVVLRGWPTAAVAVVVAVAIAVATAACVRALRAVRARRVLIYVEQSVRLEMPMPEFLRAATMAERRSVATSLRRLADSLAASAHLGDALRNAVPELPLRVAGIVRVADDNGTLPAALARLIAEREASPGETFRRRFPWLYVSVFCAMVPMVCTILAVFVLPKLSQLFQDFDVPRPSWIAWAGNRSTELALIAFASFAFATVVFTTLLTRSFRWILFGRRDLDPPLELAIDRVLWRLPLLGGLIRDRGHADVCQAVADGLGAHRPADVAIGEVAILNLNAVLADRVRVWRAAVAGGRSIGVAARLAELPTLVADLAGDRGDPTHAAAAFAFLARHYRARAGRTREWLVSFASPTITIVAGAVVGTIAYGLFDAMRLLIDYTLPRNLGM